MDFKKFFDELKRRNVYKVAITYTIVAWLILQIGSVVFETIKTPDWVMKVLLFFIVIGFPIALILAWAFEMSPQGMIRTSSAAKENPNSSSKKKPLTHKVLIGILLLIIIGQFVYNKYWNQVSINTANIEKTIAVLPLININQNDSLEYFSDGVTIEIIDELAKIRTFRVTAFTSTFPYKKKDKSPLEIANELDVNYLISGSTRVYGDSIKLSIELINPYSKERVWSQTYKEVMNNAPSIQLLIAKQVVKSLNIKLTATEKKSLDILNTSDGEAFNLFLKAKAENLKLTPEGFSESIEMLERAIDLDPNYSQAYTLLAFVLDFQTGSWFGGNRSASETVRITTPYIEKSISLNPKSSDIYLVRAHSNLYVKGLIQDAKKDVEYALALNSWPKVPTNYCICTVVSTYVALGDLQKAKEMANLGRKVDPGNIFIFWDRASIHLIEGEMQKAQALYEEALQVMDIPFFQFFVGLSYYHDDQYTKALKYFEKAFESEDIPIHFNVAYLSNSHYMLGNKAESERYRLELERRIASGAHQVNLAMAMISAVQSNVDETLTWLEIAQEKSEYPLAYMVHADPIFKPLYEELRFVEIRRKMQYYE
jgi:TolB-like protein